jgi:hypothetical protein
MVHLLLFLFRQNLYITNMSYAELVSLLRRYVTTRDGLAIQFYQSKTLKNHLAGIIGSSKASSSEGAVLPRLARDYYDVFTHAIMIDPYYGSCFVALPRGAHIDLEAICGEAGYVYMCGRCLYMRKTHKCSIDDLKQNIIDYFHDDRDYHPDPDSAPLPFRIFSRFLFPDTSPHLHKFTQRNIRARINKIPCYNESTCRKQGGHARGLTGCRSGISPSCKGFSSRA